MARRRDHRDFTHQFRIAGAQRGSDGDVGTRNSDDRRPGRLRDGLGGGDRYSEAGEPSGPQIHRHAPQVSGSDSGRGTGGLDGRQEIITITSTTCDHSDVRLSIGIDQCDPALPLGEFEGEQWSLDHVSTVQTDGSMEAIGTAANMADSTVGDGSARFNGSTAPRS